MKPAALALLFLMSGIAIAQEPRPLAEEERSAAVGALKWLQAGAHVLPLSNSTVVLPEGYQLLVGDDARRLAELSGDRPDSIEAHAIDGDFQQEVVFQYFDSGFVPVDDWADVDADTLLDGVRQNTETDNARRAKLGIAPLHVVGWLQKPTLDRGTNTVYWAFEANDEGSPGTGFVNSVALRLGRSGYEKLVLIADTDHYVPRASMLDTMMQAHAFNAGFRYADYVKGDKVAGYGVAALVGAVAGVKLLKVGAFAFLLLFLKKIGIFVVIAAGAALTWVKRLFTRRANS